MAEPRRRSGARTGASGVRSSFQCRHRWLPGRNSGGPSSGSKSTSGTKTVTQLIPSCETLIWSFSPSRCHSCVVLPGRLSRIPRQSSRASDPSASRTNGSHGASPCNTASPSGWADMSVLFRLKRRRSNDGQPIATSLASSRPTTTLTASRQASTREHGSTPSSTHTPAVSRVAACAAAASEAMVVERRSGARRV
eukprot:835474-Prymnesium_polylepis.1